MFRIYTFSFVVTTYMTRSSALPFNYGFSYIPVWKNIQYSTNYSDGTNIFPRASASVWTDTSNNVWLFGGENEINTESAEQTMYNDLWLLSNSSDLWIQVYNGTSKEDLQNETWMDINLDPSPRKLSYICGKTDDFILIYGGFTANGTTLFDLWLFDIQLMLWTLLSLDENSDMIEPIKRSSTNSWCITDKSFWIFGGFSIDGVILSDFWKLSMYDKEWYPVRLNKSKNQSMDTAKPTGCKYAITWVGPNNELYLIGGINSRDTIANMFLWKFSTRFKKWISFNKKMDKTPISLLKRKKFLKWIDSYGNLWLYGGETLNPTVEETSILSDLWLFNISSLEWSRIYDHRISQKELPGVRSQASTWKKDEDQFYFLGGISLSNESTQIVKSDSWKLSIKLQIRPNPNIISSKIQNVLIIHDDKKSLHITPNYTVGPIVFFGVSGGIFFIVGMIWFARRCVIKCPEDPASILCKKARMYTNMPPDTELTHQSIPT